MERADSENFSAGPTANLLYLLIYLHNYVTI